MRPPRLKIFRAFQTKIVLLVLATLVLSQSLGSLLSALSFESIYIDTLTSNYEILGKDLKRRIEKSLRFGKQLDTFMGMNRLVAPLKEKSSELHAVYVMDPHGKIYFPADLRGQPLVGIVDENLAWPGGKAVIRTQSHMYHILLPIERRGQKVVGILDLAFARETVDAKVRAMLQGMMYKLMLSLLIAMVLIGLAIRYLIMRPMNRNMERVDRIFDQDSAEARQTAAPGEVSEVLACGVEFVEASDRARQEINHHLDELAESVELSDEAESIRSLMKQIATRKKDAVG